MKRGARAFEHACTQIDSLRTIVCDLVGHRFVLRSGNDATKRLVPLGSYSRIAPLVHAHKTSIPK